MKTLTIITLILSVNIAIHCAKKDLNLLLDDRGVILEPAVLVPMPVPTCPPQIQCTFMSFLDFIFQNFKTVKFCTDQKQCSDSEECCAGPCELHYCKKHNQLKGCPIPTGVGICEEQCSPDLLNSCNSEQRCCSNGCGHVCEDLDFRPYPEPITVLPIQQTVSWDKTKNKAGKCPIKTDKKRLSRCPDDRCKYDNDCEGLRKCCKNGCHKECMEVTGNVLVTKFFKLK